MRCTCEQLSEMHVVDAKGEVVGDVEDTVVDVGTWATIGLVVRVRPSTARRLGLPTTSFASSLVVLPTELIASVGDFATLRVPISALGEAARPAARPRGIA